ncbi:MAG: hypothetical protein ACUVRP_06045 [Chlorobiales bacterium]
MNKKNGTPSMEPSETELKELRKKIDIGVKEAIAEAIESHRKEGLPIAVSENGKVVWKKV